MKSPPLLMGASLLFWGWQADFPVMGAVLAVALEVTHISSARWETKEEDFKRIWNFCILLFFAGLVYAFTSNDGPSDFLSFLREPTLRSQRNAGLASARTAASLLRWLPMIFFPVMAAQAWSLQAKVPLEAVSLFMRRRLRLAQNRGERLPIPKFVDVSYFYFGLTLFSAGIRSGESDRYFWGLCALLFWALWSYRSRRFSLAVWIGSLVAVVALGYGLVIGIRGAFRWIEGANPQWLLGFSRRGFDPRQTRTALGQLGKLKMSGQIVIRLEPKEDSTAPKLLREASYRVFRGQTWYAGNSAKDFEIIPPEADGSSWVLVPDRTNAARVQIASYLRGGAGVLPVPRGSVRLEKLPAFLLERNGNASLRATGPGLVIFDALSSPGVSMDLPPDSRDDLAVPPREAPALESVIAGLQLREMSRADAVKSIAAFFQRSFSYSVWQDTPFVERTNETSLSRFLLKSRRGHCEYFATATVLLLRQARIPARYAVGYAVQEGQGKKYVVRQRDAHAWCLVWNEQRQAWEDLDTTPGSWYESESRRASSFQWLLDAWSRLSFEFSKFRWGQSQIRQYAIWTLVPAIALLLFQILFRSGRRRSRRKSGGGIDAAFWPGSDSEFYGIVEKLSAAGFDRPPAEPLYQWIDRIRSSALFGGAEEERVRELLRLHYRYRFDPSGLSALDRETLRSGVRQCLARDALKAWKRRPENRATQENGKRIR